MIGDVISLTLTMSAGPLKLNNTTDSKVVIAGKDFVFDKTASYNQQVIRNWCLNIVFVC
ncbi:MAG: hypothetical protein H0A76_09965 [Candidatus Thiodubiliella endoseptemdiera]|uniref:Uncharacterized protein n=1 Tax=Candidatus Thiodubiliella endoseptemdiera TaxID=2738886 RepID=A0A853F3F8_9GAMM|nr:hypothetical protein [Candidatus Thiodubiliella endoseptemdiera]